MADALHRSHRTAQDGPSARVLYDTMIAAMRAPDSLSYESDYRWVRQEQELSHGTYRVWLRKPGCARLEVLEEGEVSSALVLDGEQLWTYWTGERPVFTPGDRSEEEWRQSCRQVYVRKSARRAESIGRERIYLSGLVQYILDPSLFFGSSSFLQPHVDGMTAAGTKRVGDEVCDGVAVSFMGGLQSWQLWLSRSDHLPRRLKQVKHSDGDATVAEVWRHVRINPVLAPERFTWHPPAGWREWRPETYEDWWLQPGAPAPDFSLQGAHGETITLANYRGKTVWLAIWRAG